MKTLMLILVMGFTLTLFSQTKCELDSRFACPNEAKDTLFVVDNMFKIMTSLWKQPEYQTYKPVIVSVKTIDPYIHRLTARLKYER